MNEHLDTQRHKATHGGGKKSQKKILAKKMKFEKRKFPENSFLN